MRGVFTLIHGPAKAMSGGFIRAASVVTSVGGIRDYVNGRANDDLQFCYTPGRMADGFNHADESTYILYLHVEIACYSPKAAERTATISVSRNEMFWARQIT